LVPHLGLLIGSQKGCKASRHWLAVVKLPFSLVLARFAAMSAFCRAQVSF
jgi:hypothetical protein